jgi:translocation and assembly module TamA
MKLAEGSLAGRFGAGDWLRYVLGFLLLNLWLTPALAVYRVEVEAPGKLRQLLTQYLDLARYQDRTDLSAEQLQFLIDTAPAQVRQLTSTEGYFSPETKVTLQGEGEGEGDGNDRVVRVQVQPGPRTLIGAANISVAGAVVQEAPQRVDEIRTNWALPPGQPFVQSEWDRAKKEGLQRLQNQRYAAARIADSQALIDADADPAEARLTVNYDSGPTFTLGALDISGTRRYPPRIIENVNPLHPGEQYSVARLLELQRQIQNTPYFSNVIVGIDDDPQHATLAPVKVRVSEFPTQRIRTGVGYATDTGARTEARYTHLNLLGRALVFDSQIRVEQQRQYGALELALPPDTTSFVNSANTSYERTTLQGIDLRSLRAGLKRARSREKYDIAYTLDYYRDELLQLSGVPLPSGTVAEPGKHQALVPGFSWTRREVDNPIFPRRGNVVALQVGAALKGVLTDQSFARAYLRARQYVPVGSRDLMIFRSEIGATLTKGSSAAIPASLLFRAGGTDSIRGYAYQSIGNVQNGTVFPTKFLLTASAEYQHWLSAEWGAAVFYDIGTAADNWHDKTLYQGVGVGARWRSPVGPVNLDLAYGVRDGALRPHISLGIAF